MLLHAVRFLCSVAAAFVRKAVAMAAAARSPVISVHPAAAASPIGIGHSLRMNNKATPVAVHDQLLHHPQAVFVPVEEERQAAESNNRRNKMKKRPSRLVIPVVDDADEVAASWGAAAAASEPADVQVQGEGFCLASRAGPRHAMEDGYAVITDKNSQLAFYGVYDGHGGRTAVDFVSEHLGRNVVSAVLAVVAAGKDEAPAKEDAVSAAITAAYLKTDSELLAQQQGASGGACAATALVKDGHIYVAHLGDCRAVLSHRDGAVAVALTADHTCASEDERARVERDGGYVSRSCSGVWRVQGSLAVSRAFGDAELKQWVVAEPAVTRVPMTASCEFIVIASDGLWDKVTNQEAVDAVRRSASRAASCSELVEMARRKGSRDDVTVMVVDLDRFLFYDSRAQDGARH